MSSAERTAPAGPRATTPPARVSQLCRMLLLVRLIITALAVLLLPASRDALFVVAFFVALVAAALAYLLWNRFVGILQRHPLLMALDVVVAFVVLYLSRDSHGPFLLCTVITTGIGALLYRWWGVLYLSVLQVVCYYTLLLFFAGAGIAGGDVAGSNFQTLIGQPLYYPLVGFLGVWIRRLLDERLAADEARHDAEVRAAARDERARLARDLHDTLNKTVRGIAMSAAALPMWTRRDPERAVATAASIAAAADAASREARSLLMALRTDPGDELDGADAEAVDLGPAVREVAEAWAEETGVTTDVRIETSAAVAAPVADEVLAIVSETLTNVDRHARAETVTVSMTAEEGPQDPDDAGGAGDPGPVPRTVVVVADDGLGFAQDRRAEAESAGHFGLVGIGERAERADLGLRLDSTPGEGTTVRLTVPVPPTAADAVQEPAREPVRGPAPGLPDPGPPPPAAVRTPVPSPATGPEDAARRDERRVEVR